MSRQDFGRLMVALAILGLFVCIAVSALEHVGMDMAERICR